jgi:hypothetical protein
MVHLGSPQQHLRGRENHSDGLLMMEKIANVKTRESIPEALVLSVAVLLVLLTRLHNAKREVHCPSLLQCKRLKLLRMGMMKNSCSEIIIEPFQSNVKIYQSFCCMYF